MLATVKENPSLARQFFIDLIKDRRLAEFARKFGLNDAEHKQLYRVAVGQCNQNFYWIFKLRNVIPPTWWYVKPDCDISKINNTPFTPRRFVETRSMPKMGQMAILNYNSEVGKIQELSRETGLRISHLRMYSYKLREDDGTERFRLNPSYETADKLSDYIPVDWWYIYPDEVDDIEIRNKFDLPAKRKAALKTPKYIEDTCKIRDEWIKSRNVVIRPDNNVVNPDDYKKGYDAALAEANQKIEELQKQLEEALSKSK